MTPPMPGGASGAASGGVPVAVPVLVTGRLVLDAHARADLDALHAAWTDPAVAGALNAQPPSRAESWFRLLRYRGLWDVLGYGYWCVRRRSDGAYVGDVGFAEFHRPMTPPPAPPLGSVPEAGWVLAPHAHGQGLATEAMRAALAWMDAQRLCDHTTCIMAPGNAASLRVARKCGYGAAHEATLAGRPMHVLRRATPQAPSSSQ